MLVMLRCEYLLQHCLVLAPMFVNPRCHFPWENTFTYAHTHSLRFKIKVTFEHKLRYKIKITFDENSFKLHQTNWNVVINNVIVVVDELSSQIIITLV